MAKLKTIKEVTQETLKYVEDRQNGLIKSLKTGYPKLDESMIDGIEWNSTITIGGRPSVGKSAYSDCIVEGCFDNNIDINGNVDFDLLDFNWELAAKVMMLRRLSASMQKTYKHIISADKNIITKQELDEIKKILSSKYDRLPITFCEEPLSVKEFIDTVKRHVDKVKRNVLVRVDHTLLTRQVASQNSQVQMLLDLLMEANAVKKQYPVIFMFLTQINREIEERQEDGTDKAFPRQGDVYGGDASAMFSETILLLNKPSKYGIQMYGNRNSGGVVVEPNDLFAHMVKNRNSEPDNILRYRENFKHMSIVEF